MGADTPRKLGELSFKFAQWRIEPPMIDPIGDASPETFVPPQGTGLVLDPKDEDNTGGAAQHYQERHNLSMVCPFQYLS